VDDFPVLREARELGTREVTVPPAEHRTLGVQYRTANESAASTTRDPFTIDPAVVDRGVRGHAATQNAVAEYLEGKGLSPRSPRPDEPQFDIAWTQDGEVFVGEIKSLTIKNEEQQLRLGLGQVLRYRNLLSGSGHVRAVLAVEREPTDGGWDTLCRDLDVLLVWPAALAHRL
jgi:hypothetical protein